MTVFVDTSAIFASMDLADAKHQLTTAYWSQLASRNKMLLTTNYVLLESAVLLARRLGLRAVRDFHTAVVPSLQVHWIDDGLHDRAMAALLTAGRRDLSLVDCVSFEIMRLLELDTAFAYDDHFRQQGFLCVP